MTDEPRTTIQIELTDIVAAIVAEMTEPYSRLLEQLLADGRVTRTELETLRAETLALGDGLGERVARRLAADHPASD